uniref:Outer dense fiber protein 1 n=1 Tax=Anas zonorhyncha TaxID=75864 RepID=A0A8B9VRY1_9AVES
MSLFNHVLEDADWDLRQAEREMQRQVRLLDRQLRHLREELPPCCPCSPLPHPPCPCLRPLSHLLLLASELPTHSPTSRSARRCSCFHCSIQRRSNRLPCASRDRNVLAVMDMKGFDPEEVSVKVKDRKVQVLAEHEEAHTSARGREYNYKNVRKEISLPPGVREDEVTYSGGDSFQGSSLGYLCPCSLEPGFLFPKFVWVHVPSLGEAPSSRHLLPRTGLAVGSEVTQHWCEKRAAAGRCSASR